ncbi:MAG: threonylcarbamoyl-AMP synthase [Bacteroidaceae bacterium]|nr:threonylcarbamoyl-AMP synthase [Bacteroidaceae bacterium]
MSRDRDTDIQKAIEVLLAGGTILYPTDTIWGIGCDATNPEAVKRVFEIKRREDSKALICLVDSAGRLQRYVRNVPDVAWDIVDLATKPTTLILSGANGLAPNLLAEDGSVGLRVTSEVFSHTLCYRFQKAIVSTSANISGEPSPQTFADINPEIIEAVDYVCLSRQRDTSIHEPSSIIKLGPSGEVTIIRK